MIKIPTDWASEAIRNLISFGLVISGLHSITRESENYSLSIEVDTSLKFRTSLSFGISADIVLRIYDTAKERCVSKRKLSEREYHPNEITMDMLLFEILVTCSNNDILITKKHIMDTMRWSADSWRAVSKCAKQHKRGMSEYMFEYSLVEEKEEFDRKQEKHREEFENTHIKHKDV
ncbi:MAG: hypothetical protein PHN45_00080 [Methylococcales bacterium]|nr:hypothetical protein [Methylococcales bacterium]